MTRQATSNQQHLGPHSRLLQRGTVDGRSREGRFLRAIEAQLLAHIGSQASAPQRMLVARLARVALRLELFDEKIAAGSLTDNDARTYGALHNALRLMLREIGLKSTPQKGPSLTEHLAAKRAGHAEAAA